MSFFPRVTFEFAQDRKNPVDEQQSQLRDQMILSVPRGVPGTGGKPSDQKEKQQPRQPLYA